MLPDLSSDVEDDPSDPISAFASVPAGNPDRQAAIELVRLMRYMSEDYYAAGWLLDLEHILWDIAYGGVRDFGMGQVSLEEVGKLIELSQRCQGWWHYPGGGERFVAFDEWLPMAGRGDRD